MASAVRSGGSLGRPLEHGGPVGHLEGVVGQHPQRGLVEEAQRVERVVPGVALVGHVAVEHAERAGLGAALLVLEGAEQRRAVGEAPLGEEAADLEIGVHAFLGPAEDLHHDLVAEHGRRVALLDRRASDREVGAVADDAAQLGRGRRAQLALRRSSRTCGCA